MPFNMFPYSNLHNFNLDWILGVVKTTAAAVEGIAANVESWAVRIQQAETNAADAVTTANNAQALVGRAVRWDVQSLTDVQKTQARTNIDAASPTDIPDVSDVVRYSPQTLTPTQQTRARLNIGATSQDDVTLLLATKHYVKYDEQTLTDAQKAQARNNIGALGSPDISDVVRYSTQARTPEQQLRARTNIGAAYNGDVTDLADRVADVENVAGIAITYAAQTPTIAQKAQARSNIGAGSATDVQNNANEIQTIYGELKNLYPFVNTISGTTPTITPADNNIYNCGEVTSLTISSAPATGAYSIVFTSGATAATTTIPATILGLETFAADANTIYEINVLDNRAVVGSWAVTP